MDWLQVFAIFLGNMAVIIPLWLWNRGESRTENRRFEDHLSANRDLIALIQKEAQEMRYEWMQEQKDFHYRLLEIEKARK